MRRIILMSVLTWMTLAMHAYTVTDTIFNRSQHEDYAFGADISFVPQMEGWGTRWLNMQGKQREKLH